MQMDCSTDPIGGRREMLLDICITHTQDMPRIYILYFWRRLCDWFHILQTQLLSRLAATRHQIAECAVQECVSPLKYDDIMVRVQRDIPLVFRLFKQFPSAICKCSALFFRFFSVALLSNVCPHFCRQHDVCVTSTKTPTRMLQTKERLRHTHSHTHTRVQCKFTWLKNTFYFPTHKTYLNCVFLEKSSSVSP